METDTIFSGSRQTNGLDDTTNFSVFHCARCGEDHTDLSPKTFQRPVIDEDGTVWDRWVTCPTTGDPILITTKPE